MKNLAGIYMRIILFLLALSLTNYACACSFPIGGKEYDSQIQIIKTEYKNKYRVSVPRFMCDLPNEAQIILAYSKENPGGIPIYDKYEILKTIVAGEKLEAEFTVIKKEKKPYVVVMWWPEYAGLCPVQANTGFLEVE